MIATRQTPFETLLERVLPGAVSTAGVGNSLRLCGGGRELPVFLRGVSNDLVQVDHALLSNEPFDLHTLLVLRMVIGTGEVRVDLPVEVIENGRVSMVLRVHASPVVLRRRMVRDQAIAEAVGMGVPRRSAVA